MFPGRLSGEGSGGPQKPPTQKILYRCREFFVKYDILISICTSSATYGIYHGFN